MLELYQSIFDLKLFRVRNVFHFFCFVKEGKHLLEIYQIGFDHSVRSS
jgi:hypothetical protein